MRGSRGRTKIGAATATGVSLAVLIGLSACVPEPAPKPTATATNAVSGFASDDEAFRAAEATYRAYVEALNRVDLGDPRSVQPVYAWLEGDALDAEKRSFEQMHDSDWTVSGQSRVIDFLRVDGSSPSRALACLDVSSIRLADAGGQSQVDKTRRDVYALLLEFSQTDRTTTGLLIASSKAVETDRC